MPFGKYSLGLEQWEHENTVLASVVGMQWKKWRKKTCSEAKSSVIVQILIFLSCRKSNCCRRQYETSQDTKQLINVVLGDQKLHIHNYKCDPWSTCREPITVIIFLPEPSESNLALNLIVNVWPFHVFSSNSNPRYMLITRVNIYIKW